MLLCTQPKSGLLRVHRTGRRSSTAQHSTVWHSTGQHCTAQHGTATHSAAQHSTAQHSTAQHGTAQHKTSQDSTARHSAAQHSTHLQQCAACVPGAHSPAACPSHAAQTPGVPSAAAGMKLPPGTAHRAPRCCHVNGRSTSPVRLVLRLPTPTAARAREPAHITREWQQAWKTLQSTPRDPTGPLPGLLPCPAAAWAREPTLITINVNRPFKGPPETPHRPPLRADAHPRCSLGEKTCTDNNKLPTGLDDPSKGPQRPHTGPALELMLMLSTEITAQGQRNSTDKNQNFIPSIYPPQYSPPPPPSCSLPMLTNAKPWGEDVH